MLLLIFSRLWVLVVEDKVDFVSVSTLVWAKHDDVGRSIGEFLTMEVFVLAKKLEVCTTAFETACTDS